MVVLIPGMPASEQEIPFEAEAGDEHVSWFVDGELVRTLPARQRLFSTPRPGRHEVMAVADGGAKARRVLEVRGRID